MNLKNYKNIQTIIKSISKNIDNLENGKLHAEQISSLLEDSRNLHERIAILQYLHHKGDLVKKKKEKKQSNQKTIELNFEDINKIDSEQTSLLDAIDEEKKQNDQTSSSINESFANKSQTLADKLGKIPIENIITHLGINEKFLFINELFKSDSELFKVSLQKIDSLSSFEDAKSYLEEILKQKETWNLKNKTLKKFINLVERRYL
jgi:hypothetical protein